jgi:hypothetical protein
MKVDWVETGPGKWQAEVDGTQALVSARTIDGCWIAQLCFGGGRSLGTILRFREEAQIWCERRLDYELGLARLPQEGQHHRRKP